MLNNPKRLLQVADSKNPDKWWHTNWWIEQRTITYYYLITLRRFPSWNEIIIVGWADYFKLFVYLEAKDTISRKSLKMQWDFISCELDFFAIANVSEPNSALCLAM